ncbi:hypothetical protein N2152v2_010919 [Parachlorella kessleri]
MAGGGVVVVSGRGLSTGDYRGGLTVYVVMVAFMAACGGLLLGYDNGVTGGVVSLEAFEKKFFPDVWAKKQEVHEDSPYCTYDNAKLQLFVSSLFLAGLVSCLFASWITRNWGRKVTMGIGGAFFVAGGLVNAFAQDMAMLIVGRVLLGFGVGLGSQVVPQYLSEVAPFSHRGMLNIGYQLFVTIGILIAGLVNYAVRDWENGWRLSLGLAAAPGAILFLGSLVLPESPNFLVEKGKTEKGREVLQKLRGTSEVDAEFADIVAAVEIARPITMRQSWASLFTRRYMPQLLTSFVIQFFQQFTGINAIIFYVPVLFSSLGSANSAALLNTVVVGAVNVGSTLIAVMFSDKFGRRFLLIEGGIQCCLAMLTTGVVLAIEFAKYGTDPLPKAVASGILAVICIFISGFAWSWGPMGWLIPSEIFTLETRPAGTAVAVVGNFLFSFVIGQAFVSMLCAMEYGVFLFFAGWLVIMVLCAIFLLPETKGVPIERVQALYARHWFWNRVMGPAAAEVIAEDEKRVAAASAIIKEEELSKAMK